MSEYSGFILVNRNTSGPSIFIGCHRNGTLREALSINENRIRKEYQQGGES
jgi:hypothetical protein